MEKRASPRWTVWFSNRKICSTFWAHYSLFPLRVLHHLGAAQGKCRQDKQCQEHLNPFLHFPSPPFIRWVLLCRMGGMRVSYESPNEFDSTLSYPWENLNEVNPVFY